MEDGILLQRDLGDGREICVVPQLFGNTKITIGVIGSMGIDDSW